MAKKTAFVPGVTESCLNYYSILKQLRLFFVRFMQDHATSALIWNYKTREELREALENEIRSFTVDKVMLDILCSPTSLLALLSMLGSKWQCGDFMEPC